MISHVVLDAKMLIRSTPFAGGKRTLLVGNAKFIACPKGVLLLAIISLVLKLPKFQSVDVP